jgi:hypothetical protein
MNEAPPEREPRFIRRHPRALVASGLILVAASLWAWWALQLWGLPDIGDPFDVKAFQAVRVPDEHNAFVEYCHAETLDDPIFRKTVLRANQSEQTVKDYLTHAT